METTPGPANAPKLTQELAAQFKEAGELFRGGQIDRAAAMLEAVLQQAPQFARGWFLLGFLEGNRQRFDLAAQRLGHAVALAPKDPEPRLYLARALVRLGRLPEAIVEYEALMHVSPRDAAALAEFGNVLRDSGAIDEAIEVLRSGLQATPRSATLCRALGAALAQGKRSAEAIAAFSEALALEPDDVETVGWLLREKARLCEWRGLDKLTKKVRQALDRRGIALHPFLWTSITDDAAVQRRVADIWAAKEIKTIGDDRLPPRRPVPHDRIRVGYLSSEFHDHAVAYLLAEVIELHDRTAFEVVAYSYGSIKAGHMYRRLQGAFDDVIDLEYESDAAAARQIRADEIDILVDLKGYTKGARLGISVRRPAPIIVSYLGYPGSLGAGIADYLIGDPIVTPLEAASHYAEKLVLLPHCYQPRDRKCPIVPAMERNAYGLPDQGLVLCCFNQNYKLSPAMMDEWCAVLLNAPSAVLWLLDSRDGVLPNLRNEVKARGIDPARLVGAAYLPLAQHLARLACADLYLDTFPYGAHTMASDALWAGVPLVTLAGESFASRVAASLLHGAGLGDLVAWSLPEYRALALELATDSARLRDLRQRLADNRPAAPLFDSVQYTQDLERAYRAIWERALTGLPPDHVALAPAGG